jgi:ATP-dependent 26S proteasome regulatory subunit
VTRETIILPEGLLARVERQTIGFSGHAERLRALGRHMKRGVLLYGPPGTGKTLVTRYILSAMEGRTTVVLTGRGMGLISQACALARALQPATVVLEDVDLVAEERTRQQPGCTGVLFELLNEMDGSRTTPTSCSC